MPHLVHRLLVTLRTLMEEDAEPLPRDRRRRSNSGIRNCNRNKQTSALILTFRDLFRSGGMNIILEEIEANRRSCRKNSYISSPCRKNTINEATHGTDLCATNRPRFASDSSIVLFRDPNDSTVTSSKLVDEVIPLLQEDAISVHNTDLVPRPVPILSSGFFSYFFLSRQKQQKTRDLTVPLNPDDENKTVETLRKVLKWSPRKQNSAKFAVSLPAEEKYTALAVVENAVNTVKEEQLRRKKRKFFWLNCARSIVS